MFLCIVQVFHHTHANNTTVQQLPIAYFDILTFHWRVITTIHTGYWTV